MKPLVLTVVLLLGACASVEVNRSGPSATTLTDFQKKVGLMGSISVPSGSLLVNVSLDGQQAYCTPFKAFHAFGDNRAICFEDPQKSGILTSYYILGSLRNLKSDVSIPYVLEGDARRLEPTLAANIVEAHVDQERQQDEIDTIRAKQMAGVKLSVEEAKTLTRADRAAVAQQAEAQRAQPQQPMHNAPLRPGRRLQSANSAAISLTGTRQGLSPALLLARWSATNVRPITAMRASCRRSGIPQSQLLDPGLTYQIGHRLLMLHDQIAHGPALCRQQHDPAENICRLDERRNRMMQVFGDIRDRWGLLIRSSCTWTTDTTWTSSYVAGVLLERSSIIPPPLLS